MRWTIRLFIVFMFAWAIFMVSPFVALYDLAKAVKAQDLARVEERVNLRAVRLALSKQLVSEYLKTVGRGQELDSFNRNLATSAGATIADPIVAQLVTPEAMMRLLNGSLPQEVAGGAPTIPTGLPTNLGSLGTVWRTYIASESRGFRSIIVPVPEGREKAQQFRLTLRLSGWSGGFTWRLTGVELPEPLLRELIRQLPRGTA